MRKKPITKYIHLWLCLVCCCISVLSCSTASYVSKTQEPYIGPADKVEVVYFHRPHRCTACIFAEERIIYVLSNHYKDEMESGRITLGVYDITDKEINGLQQKFGAYGSQLFVNRIKDGIDHIRYIEEIWTWECLDNKEIFDTTIIKVINNNLYGDEYTE